MTSILSVLLLFLPSFILADNFHFSSSFQCTQQSPQGSCSEWNDTTTLYRYSNWAFYCFPAETFVLTEQGPSRIQDITFDDSLFSLDLQTGKSIFAPMVAWLHHDPISSLEYSSINTTNGWQFTSSDLHNIAFTDSNSIDFKFFKNLNPGDILVGLTPQGKDIEVKEVSSKAEKRGLYSPFTETGTFYIFPQDFDLHTYLQNNEAYPMILVHSLSQVRNPQENFYYALKYMTISGMLFDHYQPGADEQYVNPLLDGFKGIFGSDWVDQEGRTISHKYASSNNQRYQEQKRKTVAVAALEAITKQAFI